MSEASFNHKAANLWTSRIIPLILVGIVGYVTWVVVVLLCGELSSTANLYLTNGTSKIPYQPSGETSRFTPRCSDRNPCAICDPSAFHEFNLLPSNFHGYREPRIRPPRPPLALEATEGSKCEEAARKGSKYYRNSKLSEKTGEQ